jgi:antitoxin (DNA-binding transcriptional repressor) of toxin-antitoxin stability system
MKKPAKQYAVEQLPREVAELVEASQCQRVVLTRNGVPFALIVGIEHKDEEDLQLEASPEFWQMIAESRCETGTVSLENFTAGLEAEEKFAGNRAAEARAEHDPAQEDRA